jgi:Bacterial SH3 domain
MKRTAPNESSGAETTPMRGVWLLLGTIAVSQLAMMAVVLRFSPTAETEALLAAVGWPWLVAAGALLGGPLAFRFRRRTMGSRRVVGGDVAAARRLVRPVVAGIVGLALVAAALVVGFGAKAQAADLSTGEPVVVDAGGDGLYLRADATLNAGVIAVLTDGTGATVVDGPISADGYTWYQVDVDADGTTGWVAGEYLAAS